MNTIKSNLVDYETPVGKDFNSSIAHWNYPIESLFSSLSKFSNMYCLSSKLACNFDLGMSLKVGWYG